MARRYGVRVVLAGWLLGKPRFQARCEWPGCHWRSPEHPVKAGASDEARHHRTAHRTPSPAGPSKPPAAVVVPAASVLSAAGTTTPEEPR